VIKLKIPSTEAPKIETPACLEENGFDFSKAGSHSVALQSFSKIAGCSELPDAWSRLIVFARKAVGPDGDRNPLQVEPRLNFFSSNCV
jgi:hypothetical protein